MSTERCHTCFHRLDFCTCINHLWDHELANTFQRIMNESTTAIDLEDAVDTAIEHGFVLMIFPDGMACYYSMSCPGCDTCDEVIQRLGLG